MNKSKLLQKLLSGSKNIGFTEAVACAEMFGFRLERIKGSHHIFVHPGVPELVTSKMLKGKKNHIRSNNCCNLLNDIIFN